MQLPPARRSIHKKRGKMMISTTTTALVLLLTSYCCSLIPVMGHEGFEEWDSTTWTAAEQWPAGELNCAHGYREFNPLTQKRIYYVGVHAPGGIETARKEFQLTFETYLTETVGKRWNPSIEFKMKPSMHPLQDWVDDKAEVDFMYSDTGLYSCIGVEMGGQPLGTTISHLEARGREFDLDVFGGSMVVRADNKELNNIDDLKDKIIGAQSMTDFAGAQVQFYVMFKNGLDYIMDPKQVIFTDNDEDIVLGVLEGRWDVGFVRTGMIERSHHPDTGDLLDPDLFKVLEPKIYVMDNGDLFPFLHSTPVFPEWPFYANPNVDRMVSEEVSLALINFEYHNHVGHRMHECMENSNTTDQSHLCFTAPPVYFDHNARCDTTRELAELAYQAGIAGRHSGFRPARSHFDLRTMQQDAGFLLPDKEGEWHCPRASTMYDSITCPEGHFKVSKEKFERQCDNIGLPCPDGYTCYCKPCVKAHEVDVVELDHAVDFDFFTHVAGCDKMSLCATVQQTKEVFMRAYDNRERENIEVTALMHVGQESRYLPVTVVENVSFAYDFSFSHNERGVGILEVYVDGEQIPTSPFRVEVTERDCDLDYPGGHQVATDNGQCQCFAGTLEIGGDCVSTGIVAAVIAVVLFFVLAEMGWCYLKYRRAKNDEMWQVNTDELHFSHPVEVIGQGSFGVVLLAEYRGTKVAIKRVLPMQQDKSTKGSMSRSNDANVLEEEKVDDDIEKQDGMASGSISFGAGKNSLNMSRSGSVDDDLDFLGGLSVGGKRSKWAKWFPALFPDQESRHNLSILGTASGTTGTSKSVVAAFCPWLDANARRQQEFMIEMRLLSRLRHPCITTVMGAVVASRCEPMMVMEYMENGSLYDLLRNETLYTGGEIIMQIVRDVSQGLRFLHASKPPILHGDLKAKNILIDSRFRAKVADFGLATKTKNGLSGTPFWMAPEYLRQKTEYNTSCDVYAFGIIMYEIYSRKTPYEGEHPRRVLRRVCDPRINYRPPVPGTCPPKMAEIMTKCWSSDPFFRPHSKDLDLIFMDMNPSDAEPVIEESNLRLRKEVASGDMLYKVFPKKVADKIKAGQKVEPETHEMVTVFFSDIVGFTDISRMMPPGKVCDMLDRLYIAFDGLSTKHDVFKVETIGDAWMGVTNLENDQNESHVRRIAEFAVDAVEAAGQILIDQEDPLLGYVRIRVGFHSGQVVSNVIGSLNPRFGLFGDTVNTASRMESNSISGKIQCSAVSATLLQEQAPDMPLKRRGKVAVKGKGSMVTFWVGDSLLKEEIDGSISRTYDEVPVVAFKESPVPSPRVKGSPHHSMRICMDGSLEIPPLVSKSALKNGSRTADLAAPVTRGRSPVRVMKQALSSAPERRDLNLTRSLSQ